jgi:hypothetical protein
VLSALDVYHGYREIEDGIDQSYYFGDVLHFWSSRAVY